MHCRSALEGIPYNASLYVGIYGDCCWIVCQDRSLSHRCVWVAQGHLWQWCLTPALSRLCLGSLSCWNMNFQPTLSSWELWIGLSWLCSFIFPHSDHYPCPILRNTPAHLDAPPTMLHCTVGLSPIEQVKSGTSLQIKFLEFRSRRSIMDFVAGSGIQDLNLPQLDCSCGVETPQRW